MDQHIDNSRNEFLWSLLADPANDARLYAYNLQQLVNDFPQSGILQVLLANASDDKNLKRAAVYFDSKSLFKLINSPSNFNIVADERIVKLNAARSNGYHKDEEVQPVDENSTTSKDQLVDIDPHGSESYLSEHAGEESNDEIPLTAEDNSTIAAPEASFQPDDNQHDGEQITEVAVEATHNAVEQPADATDLITADATVSPAPENNADEPVIENKEQTEQSAEQSAEQSPVDLIASEDTLPQQNEHDVNAGDEVTGKPEAETETQDVEATKETTGDKYQLPELHDEADKLIVGNIAATDFFMFDRAFGESKETGKNVPATMADSPNENGTPTTPAESKEHQDLSKYNDDKMPYTFMWWLDKTRKEHASINQPYIKPETTNSIVKGKNVTDELQQQYFENIFHITSVDELDKHTAPRVFNFGMKPKEQVIIERFIKEEPQIKPQSGDKLDNENKAKKSSEDRDELVTETLAAIYVDQMLYHKAIASYKKLMLKYPEKSRYFAGKIEQLEKKTN